MANERNPNDPFDPRRADEPYRRPAPLDNELQPDPELSEGPATGGRIAMFAITIAVILGAVFYGLNNSSINPAGTATTSTASQTATPANQSAPAAKQTTDDQTKPQAAPNVTTGAAPAKPQQPAAAPTGQQVDRSGNPPAPNSGTK